jgi:hypothetical protein
VERSTGISWNGGAPAFQQVHWDNPRVVASFWERIFKAEDNGEAEESGEEPNLFSALLCTSAYYAFPDPPTSR